MTNDPAPHPDQVERARQLMRRAASLCVESAMLLDEVRFRRTDRL